MKKIILWVALFGLLIGCAVCLSACKGGKEYTVNCQNSENGVVIVADKSVKAGEKVILAARPNVGYQLATFVLDGEVLDGCSFVMPEKDVTVSAEFEVITYCVTYVLGDASVAGDNPETYTVESAHTELIPPEKEGYEICGWYRYNYGADYDWNIEDFRVTSLDGLYGNLTLYAMYYNPLHEITLADSENGGFYVENYISEARYGEELNLVLEPYADYELDYITVNGNVIEGTSFTMPASNVEIYVAFKPIKYAITYVLFGGEVSQDNPEYYTVETIYHLDEYLCPPEKEGYEFIGWYFDEDFSIPFLSYSFPYEEFCPITLYAYYIEIEYEEDIDF